MGEAEAQRMNHYETVFVLRQSFSDEEAERAIDRYRALIEENGGRVLKVDNWGRRKLAYDIQKEKKGIYIFIYCQLPSRAVHVLQRTYRLDESILRFLTVKLNKREIEQREQLRKQVQSPPESVAGKAAAAEEGGPVPETSASSGG